MSELKGPLIRSGIDTDGHNVRLWRGGNLGLGGRIVEKFTEVVEATAGVVTYTVSQFLDGLILRDPNGAGRSDVSPTAAALVAAIYQPAVGDAFTVIIRNTADAAETITLTAGTGVTIDGTATIAQNNTKIFLVRFDNVTSGSEAVTIYSLLTGVH